MHWRFARFEELTARDVHDIYRARIAVFVLEQSCAFQDVDGVDPHCWHLTGTLGDRPVSSEPSGLSPSELLAYCRLVPPGLKYPEPSIGRVLTKQSARGTGAGRALMREAVARAEGLWPGHALRIGAQQYLEKFYGEFGFERSSDVYMEDGIAHIEMIRK